MFNPFSILNLEQSYSLDLNILEKHYFAEQKKYHPDQFFQGNEQEKAEALKKSTAANQAYLILKNPLSRAEYLLKATGVDPLSNDPSFLGQVMEWNERRENGEDLTSELLDKEKFLFNELEKVFSLQDYEKGRVALYQLTYVQKMLNTLGDK